MQLTRGCIMHERLHQRRWPSRFFAHGAYARELDKNVTRGCYEIRVSCTRRDPYMQSRDTFENEMHLLSLLFYVVLEECTILRFFYRELHRWRKHVF